MARSQPAGSDCDAGSISHADAEAADTNAFTCPIDQYADCIRDCYINRDAIPDSDIDSYVDAYPHGYAYAYADSNAEAADCDSLSNAYATSDHRSGSRVGSIR